MKLKKKITALCAAILLLVAASLCAAMLWQVREQSYGALLAAFTGFSRRVGRLF